ncbi:hypothetical protein COLO4_22160 [Corchorus olitorius]|uniref:Uncharacterized protein n=1 Tax=Corchorus olitorius TaxID=93759 RepID=A0A1R3INU8_9ROSI|nr:hypothetical protein COLO4_22160 [Corchorus olitorius]
MAISRPSYSHHHLPTWAAGLAAAGGAWKRTIYSCA